MNQVVISLTLKHYFKEYTQRRMSVILDASEYKYFPQLFTSLQSMQQFKFQCHTKCLISFSLITLISDLLKILYTALIQLISFLKHMFN